MRIQHNIAALNSYRQLGTNNSNVAKNLEKLSSGYRINRAGDDAAGLAISEKMRAQIKGLETAQKNAQDGISLIQTAEGNLTEVHSMLNRMVELATQSANGTYQDTNREELQKEINSLNDEINRISKSANFNGIKLLDGSLSSGGTTSASGSSGKGGKMVNITGIKFDTNGPTWDEFAYDTGDGDWDAAEKLDADASVTVKYTDLEGKTKEKTLTATSNDTNFYDLLKTDGELSQLFVINDTSIKSRIAGASAPKVLSITSDEKTVKRNLDDSTVGMDTTVSILKETLKAANLPDGTHFTIGDKTYEVNAEGKAQVGNIEIDKANIANSLLKALKDNGVTASLNDNGDLVISDLSKISVDSKGASVGVDASTGIVAATTPTKNTYSVNFAKDGSGGAQTLKVTYQTASGETKTALVDYTSNTTAADNKTAITAQLKANQELSQYFDIQDGSITARETGSKGAQLLSIETSDETDAGKSFAVNRTQVGNDAMKTLQLTNVKPGSTVTVNGKTFEFVSEGKEASAGNIAVSIGASNEDSAKALASKLASEGVKASYDDTTGKITFSNSGSASAGEGGLVLQVGETNEDFQKVTVSVDNMSAASLGLASIDISNQETAGDAITAINKAIDMVSSTRGTLGALQNRLEHTINNLGVTTENMTSAESRIRDTDMAKEMMDFTKNNILTQAAQAMLAQANTIPQGVLQLLQ